MNRLGLVVLWFALQFVWNLTTKQSPDPDAGFGFHCLYAIGYMTTPIQLLLSAAAMVVIWKRAWSRKSLAERQQTKAETEGITLPDEPEARWGKAKKDQV
jgi:hypothetical protein